MKKNILYVVQGKDNPKQEKHSKCFRIDLINETSLLNNNYTASIRYRSQDTPVKVTQNENGYIFEFSAPQWAPAVGQSLVLFQENECLGGGVISGIFIQPFVKDSNHSW
ncbi:aminomethyltransferase beta-barrel domain-containing protein [Acinetobacter baumannii]